MQHGAVPDQHLSAFFHEFSDVWSIEERIQIRSGTAVHDLLAILHDEAELEQALRCTEWYSQDFRRYAGEYGYVRAFEKPLQPNDLNEEFNRGVLPILQKSFPGEAKKLEALTWNESMKLFSVMSYLEQKYVKDDARDNDISHPAEDAGSKHKRFSSAQKLILGRDSKQSVLSGHLEEIIPHLHSHSARQKGAAIALQNDKGKDKDEAPMSVRKIEASAETKAGDAYHYVDRRKEFVPNIENNVTAFKRDFTANHTLNGVKHLGFAEDERVNIDEINDQALIAKTRQILVPGVMFPITRSTISCLPMSSLLINVILLS